MKRILAFDSIRAIAILGIVVCHLSYAIGYSVLGEYLGGSFNMVFFVLSAILSGLSVEKVRIDGTVGENIIL